MNLQVLLDDPSLPGIELTGLSEHSAEVQQRFGFIGVAANDADLLTHCMSAVSQGAAAVLVDAGQFCLPENLNVPVVQVPGLAARRGELAAKFYADPSANLACVGVTGTNGKTSVAYHIADLSTRLGVPMGYCGTLGWGALDALQDGEMTTANAVALQRQLAAMYQHGMRSVALEVSSHALDQNRARAVHFDYAVFTNLSRDHLDYHGTTEAYAAAKTKLFVEWPLAASIINIDDAFGLELARHSSGQTITYGTGGDWQWRSEVAAGGLNVRWQTPQGEFQQRLNVVADFAVANITAAMATLVSMGHDVEQVMVQLPHLQGVPGRMEVLGGQRNAPLVVVDYAHTPDAVAKVLSALRTYCRGQLICVIGCGGDRDKGKRPQMGQCAAHAADLTWFTADNPRSEAATDIIDDMQAGLSAAARSKVRVCADRAQAIRAAIAAAGSEDVVLVAGKGHEDYQEIGRQRVPFDDRRVVAQVLEELA